MHTGIFGGCFDPPHRGHLAVAESALQIANLDKIIVIPANTASNNKLTINALPEDRLEMCRLCFGSDSRFTVSDIEATKSGFTPTVQTVERIQKQLHHDDTISLIIGADKLESLPNWIRADDLFRLCDFIVYPRDGIDVQRQVELLRTRGARIQVLDVPEVSGASGKIQSLLRRYEKPAELTDEVTAYIAELWLYLDKTILEVEQMRSQKRWKHTLGVRKQAVEYALLHSINPLEAALAALLHDSAKCLPFENMLNLAREAGISNPTFLSSPAMLHGPVGAYIAKTQFYVTNPDVLNAISYHTVGRAEMSKLEMCIFVADATEPGREQYPGLKRLRKLAARSLEAAVLLSLNLTKQYILESGKQFNPISDATIRWITPLIPEELIPLTIATQTEK